MLRGNVRRPSSMCGFHLPYLLKVASKKKRQQDWKTTALVSGSMLRKKVQEDLSMSCTRRCERKREEYGREIVMKKTAPAAFSATRGRRTV